MSVFPRRQLLASALLGLLSVVSALPAAAQNYPARPITLIVPWGAGGGTDATARIIGSLMEKDLGQPVNVVNRTGGSGVVGHAAIASAQPDGYTIGLATVEIGMMHWQGLTELTSASYTPIGLVNADPAGVQVRGILQLSLCERCARGGRPVHGLAAPVDVAVEHHLTKHPQLGGLIGGVQGHVGRVPVPPDAVPAGVVVCCFSLPETLAAGSCHRLTPTLAKLCRSSSRRRRRSPEPSALGPRPLLPLTA